MYPPVDHRAVGEAIRVLEAGGLVAIPTETVYGLAADADNRAAVMATFAVKGRPASHPLIVHLAGSRSVPYWAAEVPESANRLFEAFWPGPLTVVLKKGRRCGSFVTGGQDTVALRCPSHPWAHELLERFCGSGHRGLTAPSCNTFGRISPSCARHVIDDLGVRPQGALDYILDGGPCGIGIESTMVNLSGGRPEILRFGAVTREMLEDVLGVEVPDAGRDAPRAPGRLRSHYAPRTRLELVAPGTMGKRACELAGETLAVMAPAGEAASLREKNIVLRLVSPETAREYGRVLYERLHELDDANAGRILVSAPPSSGEWAAVNDRLGRASAEKR